MVKTSTHENLTYGDLYSLPGKVDIYEEESFAFWGAGKFSIV